MAVLQRQPARKSVYERGVVACEKCATPIYVYKYKSLPEEFSVRCSHCGGRGMYKKRAIAISPCRSGARNRGTSRCPPTTTPGFTP